MQAVLTFICFWLLLISSYLVDRKCFCPRFFSFGRKRRSSRFSRVQQGSLKLSTATISLETIRPTDSQQPTTTVNVQEVNSETVSQIGSVNVSEKEIENGTEKGKGKPDEKGGVEKKEESPYTHQTLLPIVEEAEKEEEEVSYNYSNYLYFIYFVVKILFEGIETA